MTNQEKSPAKALGAEIEVTKDELERCRHVEWDKEGACKGCGQKVAIDIGLPIDYFKGRSAVDMRTVQNTFTRAEVDQLVSASVAAAPERAANIVDEANLSGPYNAIVAAP